MKIIITEEQKKNLFIPRNIDKRAEDFKEIIKKRLENLKSTPFGKLSKDSILVWIQDNLLDQDLKISYKGPILGRASGSSYNKSTGDVTLYFENETDSNIGIRFKIKDIEIGTYDITPDGENYFYPLD